MSLPPLHFIVLGMTKKKILVVDDQEIMRNIMAEIVNADENLEVCGFADDGMQAVKQVDALSPDLVLLDLEMPEWDGMGFLRHYRSNFQGKVVVLSGKVGGALRPIGDAARRQGADEVLEKPKGEGGKPTADDTKMIIETIYKVLGL